MKKVMCVKSDTWNRTHKMADPPMLEVGSEYTVTEEAYRAPDNYYKLAEFGCLHLFNVRLFATLPEQSADEMQEQNYEALIYQR